MDVATRFRLPGPNCEYGTGIKFLVVIIFMTKKIITLLLFKSEKLASFKLLDFLNVPQKCSNSADIKNGAGMKTEFQY